MINKNTQLLEVRILGHALATGNLPDLTEEDFHIDEYAMLWGVMQRCMATRGAMDTVIVGDYLAQNGIPDKEAWLREIVDSRPPADIFERVADAYVQALRAHRDRGALTETLSELTAESRNADDVADLREKALSALRDVVVHMRAKLVTAKTALAQSIDRIERIHDSSDTTTGIKTGIPKLDEKLGGWQRSDLALVAARPAVGKTALMCNLALAAKVPLAIVSTEQPAEQIVNRMLAILGRLPAWKFRNPRAFDADEWERFAEATTRLADAEMLIMDHTRPTIGDIEEVLRGAEVRIVFVDYVQRIAAKGEIYERVSAVAGGLKDIARNLDIPVVALAQINRAGAKNAGMEHLKGSGDLEQEADEVLILERGEAENAATLTLEKNRHGPTGSIDLIFDAPALTFREASTWEAE